jgi:hypothetical protein
LVKCQWCLGFFKKNNLTYIGNLEKSPGKASQIFGLNFPQKIHLLQKTLQCLLEKKIIGNGN